MRVARIIFGIFLVVGLAMLVGAGFLVMNTRKFLATAETAGGVVVQNVWRPDSDGGGTFHPRVRFQTRGGQTIEFVSQTGSSPASYSPNEAVEVVYDGQDPSQAKIHTFWSLYLGPVILGGLGSIFAGIGVVAAVIRMRSKGKTQWLHEHGQRILADFTGVDLNTNLEVGGRNPYCIRCQWQHPATREIHVFKSENIWYDPSGFITAKQMEVLIDPANPKRYHVETSFLPNLAG